MASQPPRPAPGISLFVRQLDAAPALWSGALAYGVTVNNEGPAERTLRLEANGAADFRFDQSVPITLPAGASTTLKLAVRPRRRRLIGGHRFVPFSVLARDAGAAEASPPVATGESRFDDTAMPAALMMAGAVAAGLAVAAIVILVGGGSSEPAAREVTGTLAVGGEPARFRFSEPGEAVRYRFEGAEGQEVSFRFTSGRCERVEVSSDEGVLFSQSGCRDFTLPEPLPASGSYEIAIFNDGFTGEVALAAVASAPREDATPPPDPTSVPATQVATEMQERILFTSTDPQGVEQIFSIRPDGSDRRQLTAGPSGSVDASASRDGTRVVFIQLGTDGARDIAIMDPDGDGVRVVPALEGRKFEPSFSPDASRIVFGLERMVDGEARADLYIVNADGTGLRQLTTSEYDDVDPEWSPDGRWIAYSSNREPGNHDIYLISPDGIGEPVRLTFAAGFDGEPSWSPDGSLIAFESFRPGANDTLGRRFSIWLMDPVEGDQGAGVRQLTLDPADEYDPVWSPDGDAIAYGFFDGETFDVYSVDVGDSSVTNVTMSETKDVRPTWCSCRVRVER